ncbi:type 1 glutamine amidotransferase domain-containing protein [Amaricoccus solimangrovi]|uniref:Type 1 glutamine amidotransferase n=1 Tax=Amaricoccus solimangrovi TaxID=2589815 RepID=A0A501WFF1_9RHOB|nr:type 1 glutamine amidotransferase domain-containing protein [Amaricoccus solimangrovi]TPE48289.1 type 1 glutamine amidotransferase [Amaricoccus solimangrovi]
MTEITKARIAILATDGYERSELREPLEKLRARGATVEVVSPKSDEIRSWDGGDWGDSVPVDRPLAQARVEDYDALVLPGGQINPDKLRLEDAAVAFVREFAKSGKPVGAICHGPWLLVEADAVRGRDVTSYHSIRTDLVNAGANWRDAEVVTDEGIVTSRNPNDLPAFIAKLVEEIGEGRHERALEAAH